MDIKDQIRIIDAQVNSPIANFNLFEKMQYINDFFKPDPDFSQEAINQVIHNISLKLKETKNV